MAATVTTISPRVPIGDLERQARDRVKRDGVYVATATSGVKWQVRQLKRLAYRLAGDDALDCYGLVPRPDGTTCLTVYARAGRRRRRSLAVWGEAKIH